jgi:hypothetical protein
MSLSPLSITLFLALGLIITSWLALHWRHHIHSTPLDDFGRLQERITGGRPTLVQFHAPF